MKIFISISILFFTIGFPLFGNGTTEETLEMETKTEISTEDTMEQEMGPFITYKDMDQAMELAGTKPTVLFFKADWCPSCTSAAKKFEENSDQLKDINLVVVDYDHSGKLQAKYGVTYQHTFVQISPGGDALVKWNGGATTELLSKIVRGEM